ncbi:MAG: glycosyltransferase [Flavobacterium sp.]|nr:glycosyltransferase [Flavobacterium sp.]
MTQNTKISALAIVFNEAQNIRDYLNNFSFADEIIVLDSFSTDATVQIIEQEFAHVKIIKRIFDNFSSQRNFALTHASNDWVIFFDADERISTEGISEIISAVNNKKNEIAFWIKRQLYFKNIPVHYGGFNKDKAIRVFRKSVCNYSQQLVHEQLLTNGKVGNLQAIIKHYSYENKEELLTKRLTYSKLRAVELQSKKLIPTVFHYAIKPKIRFFKHYILEFGFLDGRHGYELAQIMQHHVYMRYVYLNELYKNVEPSNNIGYEAKRIYNNTTGLGNYSRDLIRILSKFFPENTYFLYHPNRNKKIQFSNIGSTVIEKTPNSNFNRFFTNYWRQFSIITDLKKDNVSLFHGLSGELPYNLKSNNIKSVVTIHDLIFLRFPQFYNWFDRKIYSYKFKKACQQADKVIAISQQTKRDIIEFFDIDSHKIEVLYQGCSNVFKEQFTQNQKNEVADKYSLPKKFILNVGTIEDRKNIFAVVKAIQNTDIKLVIVGKKTKYSNKIELFIKQNKMTHQVQFLSGLSLTELAIIYQLATIFIYPSLYEGFGIPVIEALFSKTPVITSNLSCLPEAGGPDSIYINPNDINEIKNAIILLIDSETLQNEMKTQGFIFAQKFNDEIIAKKMIELYTNVQAI